MTKEEKTANESNEPRDVEKAKRYHPPVLEDYGDARDLTRSNAGVGPDGAPFDGADGMADGAGTAS